MTPEQLVLPRLQRLRRTGPDRGVASCPGPHHAHGDRHPSLTWRILGDGRLLLKCHSAGCDIGEIVAALGLELHDLFPPRLDGPERTGRPHHQSQPFSAEDALRCLAFEALLVYLAALETMEGKPLNDADFERLALAVARIDDAMEVVWTH